MGRPKDRKEREIERAHDVLDKSIKRRDGEPALEALLQLPPTARLPYLAAVAALFAVAVGRAQSAHDLGRLSKFAAQAAQEPRLLDALPSPAILEVRWALLWGAAQRGDFAAATDHLLALQPDLEKQAPSLLAWLSAWVQGRGVIADATHLPALPPLLTERDRLGHDRRLRARPPDPPQAPEQVEPAVILAAATLPTQDFRALMFDWIHQLPPKLAYAVRVLSGKLALREVLRCAPERRHHAPLSLLTAMATLPPATPDRVPERVCELAEDVLLGLRVANAYRSELGPEETRRLSSLVLLAVQDPAHRGVVMAYVATLRFPASAQKQALDLYEALLRLELHLELLATAIKQFMKPHEGNGPPPRFLLDALAGLLQRPAEESSAWLRTLDSARQAAVLAFLRDEAPPALGLDLADRALSDADAQLRHALAELVVLLIEALPDFDPQALSQMRTVGDCLKLVRRLDLPVPHDLMIMLSELPPQLPVPEEMQWEVRQALRFERRRTNGGYDSRQQAEVQRFCARMLFASRSFAGLAIKAARSDKEAIETARSYLLQVTQIDDALVLLRHADEANRSPLYPVIVAGALDRFGKDAKALAHAVCRLEQEDAPRPFLQAFARALLLVDQQLTDGKSPDYLRALAIARRVVPARERRLLGLPVSPAKTKPKKKPKTDAKAQRSRTAQKSDARPPVIEQQLDLLEIF